MTSIDTSYQDILEACRATSDKLTDVKSKARTHAKTAKDNDRLIASVFFDGWTPTLASS